MRVTELKREEGGKKNDYCFIRKQTGSLYDPYFIISTRGLCPDSSYLRQEKGGQTHSAVRTQWVRVRAMS